MALKNISVVLYIKLLIKGRDGMSYNYNDNKNKTRCSKTACLILIAVLWLIGIMGSVAYGKEFDDLNHWAKHYINYMSDEGVFIGISDNEFAPDMQMNRAMFVTVLGRMGGGNATNSEVRSFQDVPEDAYYAKYVDWAREEGIVFGTGDNYFNPDKGVTREEAATIIQRLMQYDGSSDQQFVDDGQISDYAKESVYALVANLIVNGYPDKTFKPQNVMTRAEACVLFSKVNGQTFDIYTPVVETKPQPQLTYLGTYQLTCYCSGCNSPRGSRQTASGAVATAGEYGTIAVHPSMYSKYKPGTVLYIEGVGYRKIQDKHGVSANKIDVYVGEGSCRCSYNVLSGKSAKVYLVN